MSGSKKMTEQVDEKFIQEVNEHLGIVHKVSRIYFHDIDEQKDAIQEMMFQLWKSYPSFDGRSKFSTWMYRVCLNTALTYRRKNDKNKGESLSLKHYQIADDSTKDNQEEINRLFEAIGSLSSLNKAIVLLYLEDHSYDEIAGITGLTRSNVSVRLVRIKKELEMIIKP